MRNKEKAIEIAHRASQIYQKTGHCYTPIKTETYKLVFIKKI